MVEMSFKQLGCKRYRQTRAAAPIFALLLVLVSYMTLALKPPDVSLETI